MLDSLTFFPKKMFVPVFLYHAVFTYVPDDLGDAVHNVTPENLDKQIGWLKQYYDIVHLDDLFNEPFHSGRCAVTFDDAYLSVFENALPVLESHKAPATIFVNATTLDGQIFWRDKIRFILSNNMAGDFVAWAKDFCADRGIEAEKFYASTKSPNVNSYELSCLIDEFLSLQPDILRHTRNYCVQEKNDLTRSPLIRYGNHTYSHFVLSSLSKDQQRNEIVNNHDALAAIIEPEHISRVFSIPFGGVDTVNVDTFNILKQQGYKGALLSRARFNKTFRKTLPRIEGLPIMERIMPDNDHSAFMRQMCKAAMRSFMA